MAYDKHWKSHVEVCMAKPSMVLVEIGTAFQPKGEVAGKWSEQSQNSEDYLNSLRIAAAKQSIGGMGKPLSPDAPVERRQCFCGQYISEGRLRALPNVRTCKSCQEARDARSQSRR